MEEGIILYMHESYKHGTLKLSFTGDVATFYDWGILDSDKHFRPGEKVKCNLQLNNTEPYLVAFDVKRAK